MNEKRPVASFTCDDAQFYNIADRRKHVTFGHVLSQVLAAGADAGVDRVGSLLDDSIATCGARTRRGGPWLWRWSPSNGTAMTYWWRRWVWWRVWLMLFAVLVHSQVDHLCVMCMTRYGIYEAQPNLTSLYKPWPKINQRPKLQEQEAQLPQRNSASAAHVYCACCYVFLCPIILCADIWMWKTVA